MRVAAAPVNKQASHLGWGAHLRARRPHAMTTSYSATTAQKVPKVALNDGSGVTISPVLNVGVDGMTVAHMWASGPWLSPGATRLSWACSMCQQGSTVPHGCRAAGRWLVGMGLRCTKQ